jgi:hypothetical protein
VANLVPKGLPYIYRGRREGRQGQLCRVLVRGNKNICLVEFADGFRMLTNRNVLRKVKPTKSGRQMASAGRKLLDRDTTQLRNRTGIQAQVTDFVPGTKTPRTMPGLLS